MLNLQLLGRATPGTTTIPQRDGWHTQGVRFYPGRVSDFSDLPQLFREFVVDGHAPSAPVLHEHDRVLTFGSCFANHLRNILTETGFAAESIHLDAGLNNTFALRDFVSWCCTGTATANGFRYQRQPDGNIAEWQPEAERLLYHRHIVDAAALVFVIGIAEVWEDVVSGGVFWRGVPASVFDPERHRFRCSTVAENVANLMDLVAIVRAVNPTAQIVVALSPVPLRATYRPVSCITADSVSKAILRLALDEVMADKLPGVWYWPSFEMVRSVGLHTHGAVFGDDGVVRHPADHLVTEILDCFVSCYYGSDAHQRFRQRLAARAVRLGAKSARDAYALGNLVEFADLYLGPRHRRLGWSYVEPGGVWTEGGEATLSFTLDDADRDLELSIHGEAFVAPEHPHNGLRVTANGEQIGHFEFTAPIERRTCRAVVPRRLVEGAGRHLELRLGIDSPCSPKAIGLSADARELGFFLRSLRMTPL